MVRQRSRGPHPSTWQGVKRDTHQSMSARREQDTERAAQFDRSIGVSGVTCHRSLLTITPSYHGGRFLLPCPGIFAFRKDLNRHDRRHAARQTGYPSKRLSFEPHSVGNAMLFSAKTSLSARSKTKSNSLFVVKRAFCSFKIIFNYK